MIFGFVTVRCLLAEGSDFELPTWVLFVSDDADAP